MEKIQEIREMKLEPTQKSKKYKRIIQESNVDKRAKQTLYKLIDFALQPKKKGRVYKVDYDQLSRMFQIGLSIDAICHVLNCSYGALDTLLRKKYKKGVSEVRQELSSVMQAKVYSKAYELALEKGNNFMLWKILQNRYGWSDNIKQQTQEVNYTVDDLKKAIKEDYFGQFKDVLLDQSSAEVKPLEEAKISVSDITQNTTSTDDIEELAKIVEKDPQIIEDIDKLE